MQSAGVSNVSNEHEPIIDIVEDDSFYKVYSTPLGGLYALYKNDNTTTKMQEPIDLEKPIQEIYRQSSSADEYIDNIDNLFDEHTYYKLFSIGVVPCSTLIAAVTKTHIDIWKAYTRKLATRKLATIPLKQKGPIHSLCIQGMMGTLAYLQSSEGETRLCWKDNFCSNTELQEIIWKDMTHHNTPLYVDGDTISCDVLFKTHDNIYTYSVPQASVATQKRFDDIVDYLAHHTQNNMSPWKEHIQMLWMQVRNGKIDDVGINVRPLFDYPQKTLVAAYIIQKYVLMRFGFDSKDFGFSLRNIWDKFVIHRTHGTYGSVERGPYVVAFANGHIGFSTTLPDSMRDKLIISDDLIEESINKGDVEPITKDIENKLDNLNIIVNKEENSYIKSEKLQNGTIAIHKYVINKNGDERSQEWKGGTSIDSNFKACAFGKKCATTTYSTGIDLLCQETTPEAGQQPKQRFMRGYSAIDLPQRCEPKIYYDKNNKPYIYLQKKGLLNHIAPLLYYFEAKKKDKYTIKLKTKREWLSWSLINPLAWMRGIKSWFV
jgi:hypothetical protein